MTPDREKDEAILREITRGVFSSFKNNDLEGFLSYMADNIMFMPPNMKTLYGKNAVRNLVGQSFENLNMRHEIVKTEIELGNDLAVVVSDYKDTFWPKSGGEKILMDNKALYSFRKSEDGTWIMTHCIWNRNTPFDETPNVSF